MNKSLLEKLKAGQTVFGTCIISTSPIWSKSLVNSGLDFVFLDTEHIPLDRTELTYLCQVYNAMGISPIVRILSPDPYLACMAKDAGAVGVLAPYVESSEQILDLVGATKFRPLKGERLKTALSGNGGLEPEVKKFLKNYNPGSMCIVNIESLHAVENLDKLLKIPGLDAIIIGPHDLSINLGIPEQYEHPEYEAVVRKIIHKTREKGLAAGIHFSGDPQRQIKWMTEGANIILHSSDMALFRQKLMDDIDKIKVANGQTTQLSKSADIVV